LNFSYQNRNTNEVIVDLGRTIADVCKKIKGGILVFFPSYSLMETYTETWAATGSTHVMSRECKKEVFIESKIQQTFKD
jgi:chromosome transmission fidelity protein 1